MCGCRANFFDVHRRKKATAWNASDLPLASHSPRRQTPRTMKKTRFLVLAIVVLHSFAAEVRAQLEWDTDPLTPGIQGGTGNWLTANLWNNGTNNVSWIDGSIATFSGTAGTVTVNGALTANGLTFLSNGYTIDGASTLTLGGAAPVISIPTAGVSATISAKQIGRASCRESV